MSNDEEEEADIADETPANNSNRNLTQSSKFVDLRKVVNERFTVLLSEHKGDKDLGFKLQEPASLKSNLEKIGKERLLQWQNHQNSKLPRRRRHSSLEMAA